MVGYARTIFMTVTVKKAGKFLNNQNATTRNYRYSTHIKLAWKFGYNGIANLFAA